MLDHLALTEEGKIEMTPRNEAMKGTLQHVGYAGEAMRPLNAKAMRLVEMKMNASLLLTILSMQRMYTVTLAHRIEQAAKSKNSKVMFMLAINHKQPFLNMHTNPRASATLL